MKNLDSYVNSIQNFDLLIMQNALYNKRVISVSSRTD